MALINTGKHYKSLTVERHYLRLMWSDVVWIILIDTKQKFLWAFDKLWASTTSLLASWFSALLIRLYLTMTRRHLWSGEALASALNIQLPGAAVGACYEISLMSNLERQSNRWRTVKAANWRLQMASEWRPKCLLLWFWTLQWATVQFES